MSPFTSSQQSATSNARVSRRGHAQPRVRRKACTGRSSFNGLLVSAAMQVKGPAWYGDACERKLAKERLEVLANTFDRMLDNPIQVETVQDVRRVQVFGCVEYRIDGTRREIRSGRLAKDGDFIPIDGHIDVFRPLCACYWLRWPIEDLHITGFGPQGDLFLSRRLIAQRYDWLARTFYKLLRHDRRFCELRTRTLPAAFDLDAELLSIALAARTNVTYKVCLDTRTFNRVWQHSSAFRQARIRNGRLLPLLNAYIAHSNADLTPDPIGVLRLGLLSDGLSKAAWRYTVKHGSRMFRMPWAMASNESHWEVAVAYLRTLQRAGLPPAPTPSIARAWIRIYRQKVYFRDGWCDVPPALINVGLRAANELRETPRLAGFAEEFLKVALWGCETQPKLDSNQRQGGWRWLVHSAECWETEHLARTIRRRWNSRVRCFQHRGMIVMPVLSAFDLIGESRLMRNCVASYDERCAQGLFRLFSVRKRLNSRPVAHIGISRRSRNDRWTLDEVKGFANLPLGRRFKSLGEEIVRRYNDPPTQKLN